MLRQLLLITGVEQRLRAARARLEARAEGIILHGKSVAMQVAVAAALATTAIVILVLALVAGLITLFLWLQPQFGSLAATGIVGGGLLLVAALLAICALAVFRRKNPPAAWHLSWPAIRHGPSSSILSRGISRRSDDPPGHVITRS